MALVLLADDDAHVSCLIARKLEQCGHEVLVARDGEEAWQIAQESLPALVVTDLQMPYLTGIELARLLKGHAATASTPVIMLTARGYVLAPEQLAQTNIKHLESKPFGVKRLVGLIEETLAATGAGRASDRSDGLRDVA